MCLCHFSGDLVYRLHVYITLMKILVMHVPQS